MGHRKKYRIRALLEAKGAVEEPDIVGALFGRTENVLPGLDLRKLQETDRIGRLEVETDGKTASVELKSFMHVERTALLAASLETVEKAGSSPVDIEVEEVVDEREHKKRYVRRRAEELLKEMDENPELEPESAFKTEQIEKYRGMDAGPGARDSEELIVVEGRSDLRKLIRAGVENCVAVGGSDVPEELRNEKRRIVALLDGDRGGELLRKELGDAVDEFSSAPDGEEVEDLATERIRKTLSS